MARPPSALASAKFAGEFIHPDVAARGAQGAAAGIPLPCLMPWGKPYSGLQGLALAGNLSHTQFKRTFEFNLMQELRSSSTRESILDTAEALFAQQGHDGTSMRQITGAAGVNLASVNYHFGSKESLVQAVLKRRLAVLNSERMRLLDELEAQPRASRSSPRKSLTPSSARCCAGRRPGAGGQHSCRCSNAP